MDKTVDHILNKWEDYDKKGKRDIHTGSVERCIIIWALKEYKESEERKKEFIDNFYSSRGY